MSKDKRVISIGNWWRHILCYTSYCYIRNNATSDNIVSLNQVIGVMLPKHEQNHKHKHHIVYTLYSTWIEDILHSVLQHNGAWIHSNNVCVLQTITRIFVSACCWGRQRTNLSQRDDTNLSLNGIWIWLLSLMKCKQREVIWILVMYKRNEIFAFLLNQP